LKRRGEETNLLNEIDPKKKREERGTELEGERKEKQNVRSPRRKKGKKRVTPFLPPRFSLSKRKKKGRTELKKKGMKERFAFLRKKKKIVLL